MSAKIRIKRRLTSSQIIISGYAATILIGGLLLMLPFATKSGESMPFFDALFTSTSAVCVTGLVVRDTATYFSGFGHAVILLLIQIGGVGVMTLAVTFVVATGRKLRLSGQTSMLESVSADGGKDAWRCAKFILSVAFITEGAGTVALLPVFCGRFGAWKGIWYSFFHAVSAYCNAGFDLMGTETGQFSSMTGFVGSPLLNVTFCLLIISGGLGFSVWEDVARNKLHIKRYGMQSKAVLIFTAVLVLVPSLYFYFAEFSSAAWQESLTGGERAWASLFQSITPRTAGFNTVDYSKMSEAGLAVTVLLMLVGGASGSTAGGLKITTLAVLVFASVSVFRKRKEVRCFGRRIEDETVKSASAIAVLYVLLFFISGIVISAAEQLPVIDCLFEAASAIATVGLTTGITASLGVLSRIILMLLMYFGRVGGLTLLTAMLFGHRTEDGRLPVGIIAVG
ncbi:MAG: TrkH family potassium uptake protein [Candidatus Scatosoma sp.]